MMTAEIAPLGQFDITPYTKAPLQVETTIEYEGKTPMEVFEVMGDPELVPEWYLLAKQVKMHPPGPDGEISFNVEFTFFGDVFEEVLLWEPPNRYVYLAQGEGYPIKDYIAQIEVFETAPGKGVIKWYIYYSQIEGEHFQRIIPVMQPAIIEESMKKLSKFVGGTSCVVKKFRDGADV